MSLETVRVSYKTTIITQQIILYNIHVHMYVVSLCSVSTESMKLLENYNLQYNSSHDLEGRAVYIS